MGPRWQSLWLTIAVCLVAPVSPLRCLHCTDCANTEDTYHDCDAGYDVCMKISVAGHVAKRCGHSLACGLGGLERGAVSMWNAIKNSLTEDADDQQASDGQLIYCCDRDYCNSAMPSKLSSTFLLLMSLLLYGLH